MHHQFLKNCISVFKQDSQLSQRDRAAGCVSFGQNGGLELGDKGVPENRTSPHITPHITRNQDIEA